MSPSSLNWIYSRIITICSNGYICYYDDGPSCSVQNGVYFKYYYSPSYHNYKNSLSYGFLLANDYYAGRICDFFDVYIKSGVFLFLTNFLNK